MQDANTGCWLGAIGTWFHGDGLAPGDEARLLERYLQVGALRLAKELAGFFCIVIGDARSKEVIAITDVAGSRHAFLRPLPNAIALSGSSLLLAALAERNLDATACQEFIHTGIVYQDRTIYKEVRKLPPASVLWFADGRLKKQEAYWSCSQLEPESLDDDTAVNRLWESLTQAAQQITRGFPRLVCDLTGGYDSRAAVAAFLSLGEKFSTTVSGPARSPDVTVSQCLAKVLGLPHLHHESRQSSFAAVKQALWFTDGEYDLVDYAAILGVHSTLSQKFDISINGSFGEIARGYWWELLVPRVGARRKLDSAKLARLRYAPGNPTTTLFRPEIRLELVPHLTRVVEETNAGLGSTPNTFQMDHAYLRMRMQRWQGRIASGTDQLWPCLSIFIFRPILEVMLQARSSLRQRSLMVRRMLARFQPALAAFPLEHGYPALPANWTNFYRFWPLFGYYGGKVLQRAGLKRQAQGEVTAPRMMLWQESEVRELLQPSAMRTSEWLDEHGLQNFLQESQQPGFSRDGEWQRLLSLEYTLQELQGLQRG
ncbi:MAG TPA: hypothetical protein VGR48_18250 [Terriglobales bacterium]|nr:hypothetical protein [Terriglobales bacterium]